MPEVGTIFLGNLGRAHCLRLDDNIVKEISKLHVFIMSTGDHSFRLISGIMRLV